MAQLVGELRLLTLGSFCIPNPPTVAATRLATKERGLLGILAANVGRRVSKQEVWNLLWPAVDPNRARHSLNQSLSVINKALPGWVVIERTTIGITLPTSAIDVSQARSVIKAGLASSLTSLLNGRFLEDVHVGEPEFEDWKDEVNSELFRDIELQIVETLNDFSAFEAADRHDIVAHVLKFIPASEALHKLEQRLRESRLATAQNSGHCATDGEKAFLLPFIGRRKELRSLATLLEKAGMGRGKFVLVVGSPGEGKSRLIDQFVSQFGAVANVSTARCFQPERHIGLNAIVDLLEGLADTETLDRLPKVYAAALRNVLPEIREATALPKLSKPGSQRRLFEAIIRCIYAAAREKPLLLTIEDIQWADTSTIGFLHMLARRIENAPVLCIATARPSPAVTVLSDSHTISFLYLKELGMDDLDALRLASQLPNDLSRSSSAQLMKLTGGNPFLLTEYVKAIIDAPALSAMRRTMASHDTRDFVRTLLRGLSKPAARVVIGLATFGRPVAPDLLRATTKQSATAYAAAVRQLVGRRIILSHKDVAFRHDLIREAVYRRIPALKRRRLHLTVAKVLQNANEPPGALAGHYNAAGELRLAHEFALAAALEADHRSALTEAIYFLKLGAKTAQDKVSRTKLHQDLAIRSLKLRRYEDASRHAHSALANPDVLEPAEHVHLIALELDILVTLRRISTDQLIAHLRELESTFGDAISGEIRYDILAMLIRSTAIDTDVTRVAGFAAEMIKLSRNTKGILSARAASLAARSHSFTTSSSQAMDWVTDAENVALSEGEPELAAEILTNIGSVYYEGGRYHRSLELYKEATARINASGALHIWPRTATHMHMLLVEMGRFEEARKLETEIRAGWIEGDARHHLSTLEGNVALMFFHLGESESAKKHAYLSLQNSEMHVHRITALAMFGFACLENGQLLDATRYADQITGNLEKSIRRFGDFSYAEIFIARWHSRYNRFSEAVNELKGAIQDCTDRDVGGWLRLRLELAVLLRQREPSFSERTAIEVRQRATQMGAAPTVARADALLARFH